jgi:PAS domain S-box-containing protein
MEAGDRCSDLEERLRLATSAAEIGVWDLDVASGRLSWDDTMCRLYGLEAAAVPEGIESWCRLVHRDDIVASRDRFSAAIARGDEYEFRIIRPDGQVRVVAARARGFVDAAGKPLRMIGVNYDVTERRLAERRATGAAEHLRPAHLRLNTLMENSETALFEYCRSSDGEMGVPFFTAKLSEMSGVLSEDIKAHGSALLRHVHPEDLSSIRAMLEEASQNRTPVTFKHRLDHPRDGLRWIMASIRPCAQPDGSMIFYGSMTDITNQELAGQLPSRPRRRCAKLIPAW